VPRPTLTVSRRAILGAGLALALAAGGWLLVRGLRGGSPDRNRVAVSVFVNRTGDPSLEPLGSMVADWVTRGLSQTGLVDVVDVGAIHVQGRSSEGEPTDPSDLARRNGAGTVVSGSYYLATDTLVIRATVEDAIGGTVLQTVPPVHVPAKEAVRALDQLREHVLVALGGVFDVRYSPFTARPSAPRSFQAYQAFVAGQEAYWRGRPPDEVRALFEQAVTEDSSFLASQVWLAFVGANLAGCPLTDSVTAALAPRRAELTTFDRLTLELSAARCRGDWSETFGLAKQQAGLRPRSTYAVYTAGFFGLTTGNFTEGFELLRSIDPGRDLGWLSDTAKIIYWRDLTGTAHLLGRYEEERAAAERLVREFPDRLAPRLFLARALAGLGRSRQALRHVRAMQALETDHAAHMSLSANAGGASYSLASELLVHGDTAAAREAARMAVEWYQGGEERLAGRYDRLQFARAQALLDRYDDAIATLAFGPGADSTDAHYLALRGWIAAKQGRLEAAREIGARLARLTETSPTAAYMGGARVAAGLGETERAIALLGRATEAGIVRVAAGSDLHADPLFAPLRGDARFERINRGR
jgi:tetratricopeptide (TPR) repeat protein/TolB-like protein